MSQTLAYVRVSTEDQVEFSPDAQAKRCRDLARLRDLGPVTVLADEGWSGKNLERPAMRELLGLIAAGEVGHLLIWRWDRLSRDQGDFSRLVNLFGEHAVIVHSVNEGDLDLGSASGKMQVGVTGVFAQYYRDQIVENTKMGQRQAAERGRWQNHPPTGYDMVNGELVLNEAAPLVQRIFTLRAEGASYQVIADEVGIKYSTVRHICLSRAYLGETLYSGEWLPGLHPPWSMSDSLTRPNAATLPDSDARSTCSQAKSVAGSAVAWRASTTTTATRRSTVAVTVARAVPSRVARPTDSNAPPCSACGSSRTTRTCNRPSDTN